MKRSLGALSLFALLLLFQNCGAPEHDVRTGELVGTVKPNFLSIKSLILDPKCLTCHDAGDPNFTNYDTLMAGTKVVPGSPNTSALYLSVKNGSMPKGQSPLSTEEMQAIYDWIANGALASNLTGTPPAITGSPISSAQIDLLWVDNTSNESGFRIERSLALGGPFTQVFETTANVVNYSDTALTAATTYYYRVYAFNSVQSGGYSNVVSVTTQSPPAAHPNAHSNMVATTPSSTSVSLTWQDNSNNEYVFKFERSTNDGGYSEIVPIFLLPNV